MPDAARNHAPAAGAGNLTLIDARLSSRSSRYTVRRKAPAGEHLEEVDVAWAERFKTTLRRLSGEEFELLRRHGFEVANATLATRQADRFSYREARAEN